MFHEQTTNNSVIQERANKQRIISIEGNIGAGKTTMLKLLRKHFGDIQVVQEPLNEW